MIDSKNKLMQICLRFVEIARQDGMVEALKQNGVIVNEILIDDLWTVKFHNIEVCFHLDIPRVTYPLMMPETHLPVLIDECDVKLAVFEALIPELAQKVTEDRIRELQRLIGVAA